MSPLVEIDIQKVKKHKVAGTPGLAEMNFDKVTGWYKELNGDCVLEGFFRTLLPFNPKQNQEGEKSFSDKMKESNLSDAGYDMNDCPF